MQIPVFLAVYRALSALPPFTAAPVAWTFPVVVALAAFAQQVLFPIAGAKPETVKVMRFMPLVSLVVMFSLPSGVVFYFAVSGVVNIAGEYATRWLA